MLDLCSLIFVEYAQYMEKIVMMLTQTSGYTRHCSRGTHHYDSGREVAPVQQCAQRSEYRSVTQTYC